MYSEGCMIAIILLTTAIIIIIIILCMRNHRNGTKIDHFNLHEIPVYMHITHVILFLDSGKLEFPSS